MRAIEYKFAYGSGSTEEKDKTTQFGTLLHEEDTSEDYQVETTTLYKKDDRYSILFANGCSCWEGDYDGWSMTEGEIKKWSEGMLLRNAGRRWSAEHLMAKWIKDNL